jgi:hypothetical protein
LPQLPPDKKLFHDQVAGESPFPTKLREKFRVLLDRQRLAIPLPAKFQIGFDQLDEGQLGKRRGLRGKIIAERRRRPLLFPSLDEGCEVFQDTIPGGRAVTEFYTTCRCSRRQGPAPSCHQT